MRRLLAAHRVLDAAPGVLHLAGGLLGLAFAFELGVAGDLAGHFLDFALDLMARAFDAVLVHYCTSPFEWDETPRPRRAKVPKGAQRHELPVRFLAELCTLQNDLEQGNWSRHACGASSPALVVLFADELCARPLEGNRLPAFVFGGGDRWRIAGAVARNRSGDDVERAARLCSFAYLFLEPAPDRAVEPGPNLRHRIGVREGFTHKPATHIEVFRGRHVAEGKAAVCIIAAAWVAFFRHPLLRREVFARALELPGPRSLVHPLDHPVGSLCLDVMGDEVEAVANGHVFARGLAHVRRLADGFP